MDLSTTLDACKSDPSYIGLSSFDTTFLDFGSLDPYNWDLSVPNDTTISDVLPPGDTDIEKLNEQSLEQTVLLEFLEEFSKRNLGKLDDFGQKFRNSVWSISWL